MSFKEKAIQFGSLTGAGFLATQVVDFVTPFSMSWQENGMAGAAMAGAAMIAYKMGRKGGVDTGDIIRAADNTNRRIRRNR